MKRQFYSDKISRFLKTSETELIGHLSNNSEFADEPTQKEAWRQEIKILKETLIDFEGFIFFEYSIPRMGGRIDVVLIIKHVIFVLEFKVGEKQFLQSSIDQVWDYALDLKNFHETSHEHLIAPILIATEAKEGFTSILETNHGDKVLFPFKSNANLLKYIINNTLEFDKAEHIKHDNWIEGRYSPTPTIIEAATALYNKHSVIDITRSDASAQNLKDTGNTIKEIIERSKKYKEKSICFITGVPGAGKTLVGLDVATKYMDAENKSTSVYLSGNGPLVAILREALTRDRVKRGKQKKEKVKKKNVFSEVKLIIQNVHNFRDEYLTDKKAPIDHVAVFDEAQRAWDHAQTSNFMKRKKGIGDFNQSEPEFLISCLDRHSDWAVIICLVGGGQEINRGEAGISEWFNSLNRKFSHWQVYVSSKITDSEYASGKALDLLRNSKNFFQKDQLHLSVSMRSFRAEKVSSLVKNILDIEVEKAKDDFGFVKHKYPIFLTRDLIVAKKWLKEKARANERYGIVASSKSYRLKPLALNVKAKINPVNWFLEGKHDVRSSFYLEDVATEFDVQGLELDWTCLTWDGDFRFSNNGWKYFEFNGSNKWRNVNQDHRKQYLKNAYRVLLTRARQGMIIVVPNGNHEDPTRKPEYYDNTFEYLKEIGFNLI